MIKTVQPADQLALKKPGFLLTSTQIVLLEAAIVLLFSLLPLLLKYPYRINIFLSWEGAYRLSLGHIPYKDFGLPLGFAYWLVPAMFFKLFGPYLFTLVKAQVAINLVSALAFRSVLKSFDLEAGKRLVLLVFFCLTYSFINFWPWYNHTVFVFELIGIAMLLLSFRSQKRLHQIAYIFLAGLFVLLSFLTKQDGGGLAFLICLFLAAFKSISSRNPLFAGVYLLSLAVAAAALILPFVPHGFLYWFNLGQAPHYSRFDLREILHEFLASSQWIKFYMIVVTLLFINKIRKWGDILEKPQETLFYLLTMGILVQATIIQITSYIPADNNIYYHSFALAYALHAIQFRTSFNTLKPIIASVILIFFWWSGVYYKYLQRITDKILPKTTQNQPNVVSKSTFVLNQNGEANGQDMGTWVELPKSKAFSRVLMPKGTVAGIERLRSMPQFAEKGKSRVLNMTELTPLAHELGFALEKGGPLWYHLNVSMFDKELEMFRSRIMDDYYDVVMFEHIPNLNNFYPFEIQQTLKEEYELADTFLAPRYQNDAFIEVYVKKRK